MFNIFRKKPKQTPLEKLIKENGVEMIADNFAAGICRDISNKAVAYQFILEEIEVASMGNITAKRFASNSGILPMEYQGSLRNSLDGVDAPQQTLNRCSLELMGNQELMVEFRCKVDDKIMQIFGFGKYDQNAGTSNDKRLVELVEYTCRCDSGEFDEINIDLESFMEINGETCSPMNKMAYGYARRAAAAGLFFQGRLKIGDVEYVQGIFLALQLQTGQTKEFQIEAANQSYELLTSYIPRATPEHQAELVKLAMSGTTALKVAKEFSLDVEELASNTVSVNSCLDLIDILFAKREPTMTEKTATVLQERNGVFFEPNETVPFTGKLISTFENGQKESEKNFKDGQPDGLMTLWFKSGQKKAEGFFKDGKPNGLRTLWFENGQKQAEINSKDGKEDGLKTLWFENGQKQAEINSKDGQANGLTTYWSEDGQKESEGIFKNGQQNGLMTLWFENGQKKEEINFKDGQPNGLGATWFKNGQKQEESNFKSGKKDGLTTRWFESGQKEVEAHYKDGKLNGLMTIWSENGKKLAEGNYKDGQPIN